MMVRSLRNITAIVLMLTLVAAHQRVLAEAGWDMILRALKEGEQHRAFCAKNSKDDSCKPMAASLMLVLCESGSPESLGHCHGALHAYALDGKDLAEWQCVPHATIQDFEQLRRLFIREANRMPEVLHQPARQLLYYAVAKAFPCPLRARPGR
jgi:Rap1a immunity proteins